MRLHRNVKYGQTVKIFALLLRDHRAVVKLCEGVFSVWICDAEASGKGVKLPYQLNDRKAYFLKGSVRPFDKITGKLASRLLKSLDRRCGAGQMVEETVKGVRRKKIVDETFLEELFSNMTSLYRLDQLETQGGSGQGEKVLGELPTESKVLLLSLLGIWGLLCAYGCSRMIKSKRNRN